MRFLIIILGLVIVPIAYAARPELATNLVSSDLKENARSIIREQNTSLIIESSSSAILKEKYSITILNENGLKDSYFVQFYDKNRKIKGIEGAIYDKDGNKIKRLEKSEMIDYSAISGFSIYEDNRVKFYDPEVLVYPFTVEYEYEVQLKGYINLPNWSPYSDFNISVEKSNLEVSFPSDMKIRFNEKNIEVADSSNNGNIKTYSWKVSDLKAFEAEPFMNSPEFFLPIVAVAPNNFEFEGYGGNSSTWQDFGKWINKLNADRNILPEESIQEILSIIDGIGSDKGKVQLLYKYLQDNTRYVSIQLGIGGFQPFEAEIVDRLKYGDCKALTNYLLSMLNLVGVNSYYTLVNAGENNTPLMRDFPSSQFNHAFLCVPIEKDTIWLECTSQRVPCGYMGDFTDDRDVLVVNEEGGKLVRTPKYTPEQNSKVSNISINLYENGNASLDLHAKYYGPYLDEVLQILGFDSEGKKKYLYENIDIPKAKINSYQHSIVDTVPYGKQEVILDVGNLATKMGSNLFLMPNVMNRKDELSGSPEDRITDIYIRRSKSEIDTTIFQLDNNIVISSIPEETIIESSFGRYNSKLISSGDRITYYRYFEINSGTYPKESINELYQFYESVAKADRQRVALKVL